MKPFLRYVYLLIPLLIGVGCLKPLPSSVRTQKNLTYAEVNGHPLLLDLYTPKEPANKLPILIWIHGGSWKNGSKDRCPISFMATQQLAIVSINYRMSPEAPFPAALHDCKASIRWLRAHAKEYHLDADRIGLFGASAGGHLAALLGTTGDTAETEGTVGDNLSFSSKVQAVCAFYPPTDLNQLVVKPEQRNNPKNDVGRFLGGTVEGKQDVAAQANPIRYVTKDSAPFYLLHGDKDNLVPYQQSQLLYDALKKSGVDATLTIVHGKGHGIIAPPEPAMEIYNFFQKYLYDRP